MFLDREGVPCLNVKHLFKLSLIILTAKLYCVISEYLCHTSTDFNRIGSTKRAANAYEFDHLT